MKKIIGNLDEKAEEWILIAMFVAVILLVCAQVLFRYVFNLSLGWSEEISRYTLVWITWISTSYAIKKNSHIRVEVVKDLFSSRVKKYIELVVLLFWFTLALFLSIEGTKLFLQIQSTGQVSASTNIPMWIVYLAVPLGSSLMCIRLIQSTYYLFKSGNKNAGVKS